ncbi:MAG: LysM peptidoglycan-binding domain-containing protein [Bacteroidota bacterium]|nr:LysM peptidoglycan-binding domain-containing protein [Bacteroidota bacterium]
MKKVFSIASIFVLMIGCTSTTPQTSDSQSFQTPYQKSYNSSILLASSSPSFFVQDTLPNRPVQSVDPAADTTGADSTGDADEKQIAELLEKARGHYLSAMLAQAEGDSMLSADEFEESIKHLNEASYFPNIEMNSDFNELSRSVIEDYEKYIATIDSIGPNSSIFALREKLNLDIEKIDITNIQIPPSLVPKTEVPLHINEYTKRTISFFMGKGRSHMENWIQRSGKYFPLMSRVFAEEGLPPELMYLSLPESGLNPVARSWAKAVGLWQFMKGTGGMYGLRSNYWYDERRDFEKATRAAARHMKDLYSEFNDWHLVFVAYNAGGGWVRRGIRRTGSTDYWEMRHRLPRETRNYVPQYIAVALIVMRPEAFGFGDVVKADSLSYEYVTVDDCIDLGILAECAGTELEKIKELNPELTQWCTPPNYKGYQFRVPLGTAVTFTENYAKIPDDKKLDFATHVIKRKETISQIAKRYKVTTAILLEVNKLSRSKRLKVGGTLVIPVKSNSAFALVDAQRKKEIEDIARYNQVKEEGRRASVTRKPTSLAALAQKNKTKIQKATYEPQGREKLVYKVKTGETLGHIAEWFNVRASHVRNWNNIPYGKHIYSGQRLTIWVPEEKLEFYKNLANQSTVQKEKSIATSSAVKKKNIEQTGKTSVGWVRHKVKRGESLEKIAAEYDVAIADIKSWNRLRTSRINAGEMLEIFAPDQTEEPAEEPIARKNNSTKKNLPEKYRVKSSTHIVKSGETLEKIAEKYHITIEDVKKWNDLKSSKITIGQKLRIEG